MKFDNCAKSQIRKKFSYDLNQIREEYVSDRRVSHPERNTVVLLTVAEYQLKLVLLSGLLILLLRWD